MKYSRNIDPVNGKGIELVGAGKAPYALGDKQISMQGNSAIESIWPNPASDVVNIRYSLAERSAVSLEIFSTEGRKLAVLKNQSEAEGKYVAEWQINQPDGIYICKLTVKNSQGTKQHTGKIQVMK